MAIPKLTLLAGTNTIEGMVNGVFTITLDTPAPVGGLTINFNTKGSTATFDADYNLLAGTNVSNVTANTFKIAAGAKTATLNVVALADIVADPNETVALTLNMGESVKGNFSEQQIFAVGTTPISVITADFNNDDKMDFATANDYSKNISIYFGDGYGNFLARPTIALSNVPYSFAAADFNGDGITDLATTSHRDDHGIVEIILNNGNGEFTFNSNVEVSMIPWSITAADFNGDGNVDFATANFYDNSISVRLGNGHGSFANKANVSVGSYPISISTADFNGDGKADLATTSQQTNSVSIRLGDGSGGFRSTIDLTIYGPSSIIGTADFNGDGITDLATASRGTVSILLGNGNGSGFTVQPIIAVGNSPHSITTADFNGDGIIDLATASSGTVSILLGNGHGSFRKIDDIPIASAYSIATADFNSDSKPDLVTANFDKNNASVLLNSKGTVNNQTTTASLSITDVMPVARAGFTIIPQSQLTSEQGDSASYNISLNTAPFVNQNVTLTFTSSDTSEGVIDNSTLIFTSSNYATPQTLTVRGVDDYLDDGNIPYLVTAKVSTLDVFYKSLTISPFNMTNFDDGADVSLDLYGDEGGSKIDVLSGGNGADTIHGLNMADNLSGGLGNDTLYGGYGADNLFGEGGNDKLLGEQEADYLDGGVGNDTLDGGDGVDTMIGGAGNDTYYLGYDATDVIDDQGLSTDVDTVIMPYQLTKYTLPSGIEKGTIAAGLQASSLTGNGSNNMLTGNDGSNTLSGAVGRDSLFGGSGNDVLSGGTGNDVLTGGNGKDVFVLNTALTLNTDKIADFKPVDDTIKLENLIFTKLTTIGVLGVTNFFVGAAAHDPNDYVIYNPTTGAVTYDSDGSGAGQGVIIATLGVNLTVTNADFVVV